MRFDMGLLRILSVQKELVESLKPSDALHKTATDLLLNDFAIRSFRDEGDADYISARMAFRAAIHILLWAGQQMVEKYLKCILLLNRIPGKKLDLTSNTLKSIDYIDSYGQYRYISKCRDSSTQGISSIWTGRYGNCAATVPSIPDQDN